MKFSWIRYVSLFIVLCISLFLMGSFVFASSLDPVELNFTYNYSDSIYFSNSDSSVVDLAIECFNNKWPVSVFVNGLGVFEFNPSSYYQDGDFLSYTLVGDVPSFGVDLSYYDIISHLPLDLKERLGLPDNLSVSFTFGVPSSPSVGLMSDLRLTGTIFLRIVKGIFYTILNNPFLLLTVGIFFAGGCIAIFSRLLSKD